mgnify:CR=1 FL=1
MTVENVAQAQIAWSKLVTKAFSEEGENTKRIIQREVKVGTAEFIKRVSSKENGLIVFEVKKFWEHIPSFHILPVQSFEIKRANLVINKLGLRITKVTSCLKHLQKAHSLQFIDAMFNCSLVLHISNV